MKLGRIEPAAEFDSFPPPSGFRRILSTIVKDPLLHFLLIGGLLFLASSAWQRLHDPHRIVVDRFTLNGIAVEYFRRFSEPPSPAASRAAIASYIEDEVLYREGLAQGLDRDDTIVRRRIIQKMRFLLEDSAAVPTPSDETLRAFYARNLQRYAVPAQISFHHLYFATDAGDARAYRRAMTVRAALARHETGAADRGDPFPDRSVFTDLSREGIVRVFGESPFADRVPVLPVGAWSVPLRSGMGWHLVYVDQRTAASIQPFDAVRTQVLTDWSDAQQAERNQRTLQALEARYTVVMPRGSTAL